MLPLATPDESLLLARLADGGEEPFVAMRAQLGRARIVSRFESAEGILLEIAVPADSPKLEPARFELSDVEFTLAGGAGRGFATLRVVAGMVRELELGLDEGDWPVGARVEAAAWTRFVEADGDGAEARFEPVSERDREQLRWTLAEQAATGAEPPAAGDDDLAVRADELAAHPQATIALPLLVPLAGIVDAALDAADERDIASLSDSLAADPRLERPGATAAVADLGGTILHALPGLIDPAVAAGWLGAPHADLPVPALVRRWKAWVARESPPPVMAAIAMGLLASPRRHGLIDDAARPMARELFHHVRKAGLLTWPEAHAHAQAWWREEGAAAGVWALVVESLAAALDGGTDEPAVSTEADPGAALSAPSAPAPADAESAPDPEVARRLVARHDELQRANAELHAELQKERQESRKLRAEVTQLRQSRSEWRERAQAREAETGPLRREIGRLDRYARGLQAQLAEFGAAEEAGHPDPIPELPEGGWPADLLVGLEIVLCTGQDRGGARKAMADALRLAGAEVIVHEANGKLPDRFPPGAVVVCDVRFIGHAAADRVRAAAGRSGLDVLEVRAGQGGIVRAVAVRCRRLD